MDRTEIQKLVKRVSKIEKWLKTAEEKKSNRKLLAEVLRLDWKNHGWEGRPEDLDDDRSEWKEAQEMVDLIAQYLRKDGE